VITVSLDLIGRLGLEVDAKPGQQQRQRVGEIVAGVGDQGQRVARIPAATSTATKTSVAASDQRKTPPAFAGWELVCECKRVPQLLAGTASSRSARGPAFFILTA